MYLVEQFRGHTLVYSVTKATEADAISLVRFLNESDLSHLTFARYRKV